MKKQRSSEDPQRDDIKKKPSCFSNIKIFLVAECALMLAQGTVGAYLVSDAFVLLLVLTENDCLFRTCSTYLTHLLYANPFLQP